MYESDAMSGLSAIVFVVFTVTAVSFAWGIRGDLIGGEEGAMLPGALLGLSLAVFSGSEVIKSNYIIFSCIGACSMYIGGTEPYAQTISFINFGTDKKVKAKSPFKALTGVFVKGFNWFGISAAFLGMSFTVMTGKFYSWYDILFLFACLPLARIFGTYLFNKPHKNILKNNKPAIYFSASSQEEWGGLLCMLLLIFTLMLIRKDFFGIKMLLSGAFSGGIGWIISVLAHSYSKIKMKNGKYIFGKFQSEGKIDNWKIMEFMLGAIGALGISLCFIFNFKTVAEYSFIIDNNSIIAALGSRLEKIVLFVWAFLIIIEISSHFVKRRNSKADAYIKLVSYLRRPVYCYIPLALALLGCIMAAKLQMFFVMIWVAFEELYYVQFNRQKIKSKGLLFLTYFLPLACFTVGIFVSNYTAEVLLTIYCAVYFLTTVTSTLIYKYPNIQFAKKNNSLNIHTLKSIYGAAITVKPYYLICITIITVIAYLQF